MLAVHDTVCEEIRSCTTTIMSPDTLETSGVNELFVVVTDDSSFTTEQTIPPGC